MSQPIEREIEIFNAALELPAAERAAYLACACAGDVALRQRVAELLQLGESSPAFLESPATAAFPRLEDANPGPLPVEHVGDRIGHYQLLEQLGEGGCGVVYLAAQERPVRRRVALKVIKLGMDTRSVIARFEVERQALALMDHPHIARVLDAGATATGRPYFVMELVPGIKITDYCDQNNLSTAARLNLFMQVCRAVQHAHQKGVIHRDLKPPNILVTIADGVPTPKVIDFGIAKATQGKLADQTVFTAIEQFIGTPAYMSPEQTDANSQDIDTRTDIYSLGVLLYELLTGHTPFDARGLVKGSLDEMRRQIQEQEPAKPSTRLRAMPAGDLTTIAGHRQAPPLKLIHQVRGDLDWIVMKCLEKDRSRRYETANGLAADIQRYLHNEPVMARSPSTWYVFQKLVRRRKLFFLGTGIVAAAVFFALVVALVAVVRVKRDNFQIRQAKDEAIEKLRSSYLAEARATRLSGQSGGRFASLATVQKAAAIRSDMAVRNEVIACLAVSDLDVAKEVVVKGHERNELASVDFNLEHYAYCEKIGELEIRSAADNHLEYVLRNPGVMGEAVGSFSADGRYLITRIWSKPEVENDCVWDVAGQKMVVQVPQLTPGTNSWSFPYAEDFSDDGRFFLSSHPDGGISVYELPSSREWRHLSGPHPFYHLAIDPDGRRVAGCSRNDPRVEIRDLASGRTILAVTNPVGVSALAWSADGRRLATAGMDFKIYVWDATMGKQLVVPPGHASLIMSVAFNHAGDLLASSSYDHVVRLWDSDSGRELARHYGSTWKLQFSPDDRQLLGWQKASHFGSLTVGGSRECRFLHVPRYLSNLTLPAFSADGRLIAAATGTTVHFWDAGTGREVGSFPLESCDTLLFPPDGRSLITVDLVKGIRQRALEMVDGPTDRVLRLGRARALFNGTMLQGASLSGDGRYLGVTQQPTDRAFILDLQNPGEKVVLAPHPSVSSIGLSPDGRWAATSSWYSALVKIWDAHSGVLVRDLPGHGRSWAIFSPDGRWLATSADEFQLRAVGSWEPKSPPTPGIEAGAYDYSAFSPDGRILAKVELNTIQLRETATGKPLATLEAPGSLTVLRCQFSPDGTQLAVAQADQQIQLWDLRMVRAELAQMHLDWDQPPCPPARQLAAPGPVTLEIESETNPPTP